ncbi:CAP domain-containing protein [Roseovarius sp. Pro17]|uniref:CAP domain-containing protein n=1 Tax=Roseovarius sp. Pro17 TaxID=3108175 RepID=UPI002D78D633|nr:CAP domain-containing protein [Roseovarius sp. Pro17]
MRLIIAICLALIVAPSAQAQNVEDISAATSAQLANIRARYSLPPLTVSSALTQAAAAHARDMQANGFFSHTGSDGSGIGDRAHAAGYGFCFIAENIAQGQGSLDKVMEGWMASTGHRRNILSDGAREFAMVRTGGNIWVMVLGRSGC